MSANDGPALNESMQRLRALRNSVRPRLVAMIDDASVLWERCVASPSDWPERGKAMAELIGLLHQLAGLGGTFGYSAISVTAAALEVALRTLVVSGKETRTETTNQIQLYLLDLKESLELGATEPNEHCELTNNADHTRPVYVFGSGDGTVRGLADRLRLLASSVQVFDNIDAILAAIANRPPAATIVDLDGAEREAGWMATVGRLASTCPVILLAAEGDLSIRLAAVRAGCDACLIKPVTDQELGDWFDRVTASVNRDPYRIMIVMEDAVLAESYRLTLALADMCPQVINEPTRLLETLAEWRPDLVLMDACQGEWNGTELAAVIHQHRDFTGLPVVLLSVERDIKRLHSATSKGALDFLIMPIRPHHLISAVRVRAERARLLQARKDYDDLTGLLNHSLFQVRFAREIANATHWKESLSVALIDIDHVNSPNRRFGHQAGDKVIWTLARLLRRRLRPADIIGRFGGNELAVLLPRTGPSVAVELLDSLREAFEVLSHQSGDAGFRATLSAGVATLRPGHDLCSLIKAAEHALHRAKSDGCNRVLVARDVQPSSRRADPVANCDEKKEMEPVATPAPADVARVLRGMRL